MIEHMRTKFVVKIGKGCSVSQKDPSWRDKKMKLLEQKELRVILEER